MVAVIAAAVLLLAAGVLERARHMKRLRAVPIRILVNGTRGKTSTTRMLAAALNHAGIRTFAKCTGTEAVVIAPDGTETPVRRPMGANIREFIPFVRRAQREGAEALVAECMAVRPDLQRALAAEIFLPTHTVILNDYVDHVDVMGATRLETARALANSVAKESRVVAPKGFSALLRDVVVPENTAGDEDAEGFLFPAHKENINAALAVAGMLGIDRETALRGMRLARPDAGMAGPFALGESLVINGFAANDMKSAKKLFLAAPDDKPLYAVYNHRSDRRYRLPVFIDVLKGAGGRVKKTYILGDEKRRVLAAFERAGLAAETAVPGKALLEHWKKEPCAVVLLGNTRGEGFMLIDMLRQTKVS